MDTYHLRGETRADASDPPGFEARSAQLAPKLSGSRLAMTVYDLPPGQAVCPYHFHWAMRSGWSSSPERRRCGRPTAKTLEPGDVVCFPVGPDGAHRVHDASDDPTRVALFSNEHEFGIIEYPDSDKLGVWGRHDEALDHVVRRTPDLNYRDGERSFVQMQIHCGDGTFSHFAGPAAIVSAANQRRGLFPSPAAWPTDLARRQDQRP